jgi:FERM N-terminal domain
VREKEKKKLDNKTAKMSKQKMWCLVRLPNDKTLAVECDQKSIGQECLEKVSQNETC